MADIMSSIFVNVLTALSQLFAFAVLLAILLMYFYLFATEKGNSGQGYVN